MWRIYTRSSSIAVSVLILIVSEQLGVDFLDLAAQWYLDWADRCVPRYWHRVPNTWCHWHHTEGDRG